MRFFQILKVLVTISVIHFVAATPLDFEYDDKNPTTAGAKENYARLEAARTTANDQIANMRTTITKAKAGDQAALNLYHTAFGTKADAHIDDVEKNIKALETGKIPVKVASHTGYREGEIASVQWTESTTKNVYNPSNTLFSARFHGKDKDAARPGLNADGRVATVIHEATHFLSRTGDNVHKTSGDIIPGGDFTSPSHGSKTGYTNDPNGHSTVAAVNADKEYKAVRDKANNMHQNAESYAVFAGLCSGADKVVRRDVELFTRAIVEDDDDLLDFLVRRNGASCSLPPGYFDKKNKAAAEKAAAAKKSTTPGKLRSAVHAVKATNKLSAMAKARSAKVGAPKKIASVKKTKGSARTPAVSTRRVPKSEKLSANAKANVRSKTVKPASISRKAKGSIGKPKGGVAARTGKTTRVAKVSSKKAPLGKKAGVRGAVRGKVASAKVRGATKAHSSKVKQAVKARAPSKARPLAKSRVTPKSVKGKAGVARKVQPPAKVRGAAKVRSSKVKQAVKARTPAKPRVPSKARPLTKSRVAPKSVRGKAGVARKVQPPAKVRGTAKVHPSKAKQPVKARTPAKPRAPSKARPLTKSRVAPKSVKGHTAAKKAGVARKVQPPAKVRTKAGAARKVQPPAKVRAAARPATRPQASRSVKPVKMPNKAPANRVIPKKVTVAPKAKAAVKPVVKGKKH